MSLRVIFSVWLSFSIVALNALPGVAQDLGYRFQNGQCINEKKELGYNPKYVGQCGDWSDEELRGSQWLESDLRGSVFRGADLQKANFSQAKLDGSVFNEADLTDATFESSSCKGCFFINAKAGAIFTNADLDSARADGAEFSDADFSGATLKKASFVKTVFLDVQLHKVKGDSVAFTDAEFENVEITGSKFSYASFRRSNVSNSKFHQVILAKSDFADSRIKDSNFATVDLMESNINRAYFADSTLQNVDISSADLLGTQFHESSFNEVELQRATYSSATTFPEGMKPAIELGAVRWIPKLSLGRDHTCVQTPLGYEECAGRNDDGQLANAETTHSATPVRVTNLYNGVMGMGSGYARHCVLDELGSLFCAGTRHFGFAEQYLGIRTLNRLITPEPFEAISLGDNRGCAVGRSGSFYRFEMDPMGRAGIRNKKNVATRLLLDGSLVVEFAVTESRTDLDSLCLAVTENGNVYVEKTKIDIPEAVFDVAAGYDHRCALGKSGKIYCWGEGNHGQLGIGESVGFESRPQIVKTAVRNWTKIAAGGARTFALTKTGNLYAWGYGRYGQLGTGKIEDELVPVHVMSDVLDVQPSSGGGEHTCVVLKDEVVQCFGYNYYGQLGNGEPGVSALKPTEFGSD